MGSIEERVFKKFDKSITLNKPVNAKDFIIFEDGRYPNVYQYNDLSFGKNIEKSFDIDEPTFIVFLCQQYIHFLIDGISVFLFLKQYIPNLKIKIITNKQEHFAFMNYGNNNFQREVFKLLGFTYEECLLFVDSKQYNFTNVYDFNFSERSKAISNEHNFVFKITRDYFTPFLTKETTKNKYYISRSQNVDSRSIKNPFILEKYFYDKGYTPLYLETMSFIEQANAFYNAEEIISISGTGLTNTIFCDPGTKILEINTAPESYHWTGWPRISKEMNLDHMIVGVVSESKEPEDILEKIRGLQYYQF